MRRPTLALNNRPPRYNKMENYRPETKEALKGCGKVTNKHFVDWDKDLVTCGKEGYLCLRCGTQAKTLLTCAEADLISVEKDIDFLEFIAYCPEGAECCKKIGLKKLEEKQNLKSQIKETIRKISEAKK